MASANASTGSNSSLYYFHNLTRDESNKLPVPGMQDIFVIDLDKVTGGKLIEIFKAVCAANAWSDTDVLEATSGSQSVTYEKGFFTWQCHGREFGEDFTPLPGKYPIQTSDGQDEYDSLDDPEVREEDYDW